MGKEAVMKSVVILGTVLLGLVLPLRGASYYPLRLEDSKAVYLTKDEFPVKADGLADDSAAIQAAIDKAARRADEKKDETPDPVPRKTYRSAGLVLLVAMIGAIVLTLRHKPNVRRQDIAAQNARSKLTAIEIRHVRPGEGI